MTKTFKTYTKYQRREIAKCYKLAQEYLWDGVNNTDGLILKHACLAIQFTKTGVSKIAAFRAREIIMDRIFPYSTVGQWLVCQAGILREELTSERLQQYRLEWLKLLHKEFSTNK